MKRRNNQNPGFTASTKARVQRRYELANAPYQARRRDFTSKRVSLRESVLKGLVWSQI